MIANNTAKKLPNNYVTIFAMVTWLCILGPLLSLAMANRFLWTGQPDATGAGPLAWLMIFIGIALPFVGIITGGAVIIMAKSKIRYITLFPWIACVCISVYLTWTFIDWISHF